MEEIWVEPSILNNQNTLLIGKQIRSLMKRNKNRSTSRNKKQLSKSRSSKSKNTIGVKKQAISNLHHKRNKHLPPKVHHSNTNRTYLVGDRNSSSMLLNKISDINETSNAFEVLKENSDWKFLEIIDSLRELRKFHFNNRNHSSASNKVACDSTKSNRNLKTEIEFESTIVDLINWYNKWMEYVNN